MTFPHLDGRVEALAKELDLPADKAEWLAAAALHSGCFLRSQYCDYFRHSRVAAKDFSQRLIDLNLIVEMLVDELGLLYRITSKRIYRALGADNIRHRRLASWPIMHRRLLALDYVLDHPELPWLPTEAEKMACFEALAIRGMNCLVGFGMELSGRRGATSPTSTPSPLILTPRPPCSCTSIQTNNPHRACKAGATNTRRCGPAFTILALDSASSTPAAIRNSPRESAEYSRAGLRPLLRLRTSKRWRRSGSSSGRRC